jgi:hypothetical protein
MSPARNNTYVLVSITQPYSNTTTKIVFEKKEQTYTLQKENNKIKIIGEPWFPGLTLVDFISFVSIYGLVSIFKNV